MIPQYHNVAIHKFVGIILDNETAFLTHCYIAIRLQGHDFGRAKSTFTYSGWKVKCKICKHTFKLIPGKTKEEDLKVPCNTSFLEQAEIKKYGRKLTPEEHRLKEAQVSLKAVIRELKEGSPTNDTLEQLELRGKSAIGRIAL